MIYQFDVHKTVNNRHHSEGEKSEGKGYEELLLYSWKRQKENKKKKERTTFDDVTFALRNIYLHVLSLLSLLLLLWLLLCCVQRDAGLDTFYSAFIHMYEWLPIKRLGYLHTCMPNEMRSEKSKIWICYYYDSCPYIYMIYIYRAYPNVD